MLFFFSNVTKNGFLLVGMKLRLKICFCVLWKTHGFVNLCRGTINHDERNNRLVSNFNHCFSLFLLCNFCLLFKHMSLLFSYIAK